MDPSLTIRLARPDEAAIVSYHRAAMFRDMQLLDATRVEAFAKLCEPSVHLALSRHEYRGWFVEAGSVVVAGGGLTMRFLQPRPQQQRQVSEAYVYNVYTEPEYRRRGVARLLMESIVEWCRGQHVTRIALHASAAGQPLYAAMGFMPTNEMRLEMELAA